MLHANNRMGYWSLLGWQQNSCYASLTEQNYLVETESSAVDIYPYTWNNEIRDWNSGVFDDVFDLFSILIHIHIDRLFLVLSVIW